MISETEDWNKCSTQVFWGEIAPCDHLLQIYESDDVILSSLSGFVSSGFVSGDSVIIIATGAHLNALNSLLTAQGFDVKALAATDQFIPLDAEETLAKFMVKEWPDETLFNRVVKEIVLRARGKNGRRVRAYGEMVAILWAHGHNGATVHLEHLWNKFCENEAFCLFCAYPQSGFSQGLNDSITHICSVHSKIIAGDRISGTEVFYKRT